MSKRSVHELVVIIHTVRRVPDVGVSVAGSRY